MYKLTLKDTQILLSAIDSLNSDSNPETLSRRSLDVLYSVVDNDMPNFDFFSPKGKYNLTAWADNWELAPYLEYFKKFIHQHPAIPLAIADSKGHPFKLTDGVTQSEFEQTELYNEYYRLIGINHQMGLAMPVADDLTVCCAVARGGKQDFTERERMMMKLAAPHLLNALRGAIALERLNSALELAKTGIISISPKGKPIFISDFAAKLLIHYFPKEKIKSGLPEKLIDWLNNITNQEKEELKFPPIPLKIENGKGSIIIRYFENSITDEVTLIIEESLNLSVGDLASLNLTQRESEILLLISRGKSDSEIGIICGISIATARKHIQNIYIKIGVESRTGAMLKALTIPR